MAGAEEPIRLAPAPMIFETAAGFFDKHWPHSSHLPFEIIGHEPGDTGLD